MDIYSKNPAFSGKKINFIENLSKLKQSISRKLFYFARFYSKKEKVGQFSNKIKFFFFLFASSGILIIGTPLLAPNKAELLFSEKENNLKEELMLLNGNTLLPTSELFGPELKIAKPIPVIVTAYSSTPWETQGNPFITAAGTWVRDGIVANNKYSFGTKIRFPEIYGDRIFVVEDRMNSRKSSYHFDIWFPSYSEAKEFGAKKTYIEVLEN